MNRNWLILVFSLSLLFLPARTVAQNADGGIVSISESDDFSAVEPDIADAIMDPHPSACELEGLKNLALQWFSCISTRDSGFIVEYLVPDLMKLSGPTLYLPVLREALAGLINVPSRTVETFRLKRSCAYLLAKAGEANKARQLYLDALEEARRYSLKIPFDPLVSTVQSLLKWGFPVDALRLVEEIPEPAERAWRRAEILAYQEKLEMGWQGKNRTMFPAYQHLLEQPSGNLSERLRLLSRLKNAYHETYLKHYNRGSPRIPTNSPLSAFDRISGKIFDRLQFLLALRSRENDDETLLMLGVRIAFNQKIPGSLKRRFQEKLYQRTLQLTDLNQRFTVFAELFRDREFIDFPGWETAVRDFFRQSNRLEMFGKAFQMSGFPRSLLEAGNTSAAISLIGEIPEASERKAVFLELAKEEASFLPTATSSLLLAEAEKTGLVTSEDRLWYLLEIFDNVAPDSIASPTVDSLVGKTLEEWHRYLAGQDLSSLPTLFRMYIWSWARLGKFAALLDVAAAFPDEARRKFAKGAIAAQCFDQKIRIPAEILARMKPPEH